MQLSDHFSLEELTKSTTALRLGIDNSLHAVTSAVLVNNLTEVAVKILEPVREHFKIPFSPESGYRCITLNRALKSKDSSKHVLGEAVDFEIPGIPNIDLAGWIANNLEFDQLILEFYSPDNPTAGWVHVSYSRRRENRNQILTLTEHGVSEGLPA